ncbi:MAG TPA: AcrB/AcrD/AcrF family protein [Flavobacteriales bacterium]|jgi:multidrug efflux pump subunit AcrB|nr:AcrB/AcrD/AcrF family protein [Flavobacteriales bacterium]
MRKIVSYFIQHPIWANAVIAITIVLGVFSLISMDRSFFPELSPNVITISVFYPGASPQEMEEGVTIKIEESLKGISEIDELTSVSEENFAMITVIAFQGTDMDVLVAEVKNAVDGISSFPVGAEKPIVYKQKTQGLAGRASEITLTGGDDLMSLKNEAQRIERELLSTGVISDIGFYGFPDVEYSIEVDETELLRYQLTFDEIAAAVRQNNRDVSSGTVKTDAEEFVIRLKGKDTDPLGMEDIVLRAGNSGDYITLGQVANVSFQFSDTPNKYYLDGSQSVGISVNRRYGEDLQKIDQTVKAYMDAYNAKNTGFKIIEVFSFFDLLNQRINLLTKNGVIGLVLVLLVLGLFLNVRLSAWVAFGIPFSFLGMFAIGSFFGLTINMISLFGMILVVGILVDDGIVIAENIYTHFERGKSPYRAAIDGTFEVMSSVFTSVLTTIMAFTVLLFIEGLERMSEMAMVVILALAFSLIEAFLVLPSHLSSRTVLKTNVIGKLRNKMNQAIIFMREKIYGELLDLSLKYRRIAVFFPLMFIVLIFYFISTGLIKTTFFPSIPFDDFTVEIAYKPGDPLEQTEAFLDRAELAVKEVQADLKEKYGWDLINYVTRVVGSTRNIGETGTHAGRIQVSLDVEEADISSFQIAAMVERQIGEVRGAEKYMVGGINRWGSPVSIALSGEDYDELKKASNYLKEMLREMPELKDIQDNSSAGKREIIINPKPKAYMLGLNQNEIARQLRQGYFGEEVQRLIIGRDEARVWVRFPESGRKTLGQYEQMRIKTQNGQLIPLHEVADYHIERGDVAIRHYDGTKEIEITADQTDTYASTPEILQKIKKGPVQELQKKFQTVGVSYRGQQRNANKSLTSMSILLSIAIFMIILAITLNFSSFYQAFIILVILPVGITGAALGHSIEGHPVSILSAYGMIALLGIVINDAVVFLHTYNSNLLNGETVKEAVRNAGIARFRPIILTSVTTVAGLYPLIQEKSFQAQFLIPMAISVAYGVLFGTYFILVFLPSLILFFNDMNRAFRWLWFMKKPKAIEVEPSIRNVKRLEEINTAE